MPMSNKTLTALIALAGVVFSALLSYQISKKQADISVRNLRAELNSKYNQELYKKRLDTYPKLYRIISNLGKDFRKADMPYSDIWETVKQVDAWDSDNSIYLSPAGIALMIKFRNTLDKYTYFNRAYNPKSIVEKQRKDEIFESALRVEQHLKKEIGVYDVDGFHNPPLATRYPHSWLYLPAKKEGAENSGE